ncbi:hypothetical protein BBJ28_00010928 [Nothophytophthora sp. Chile5]|nr:hypothetical protein BBJ28_00010928 [Nothophytophthora sp. Chile5]
MTVLGKRKGEEVAVVEAKADVGGAKRHAETKQGDGANIRAKFFSGARLNFAENLLRFRDNRPAIVFKAETSNQEEAISYAQLYDRVASLSARLAELGVVAGDRIAAYIPNIPEAIIAMLAATRCVPKCVSVVLCFVIALTFLLLSWGLPLDSALGQSVFATDGYFYKGHRVNTLLHLKKVIDQLPTVEKVVVIRFTISDKHDLDLSHIQNAVYYDHFVREGSTLPSEPIPFVQLPFDHPVYIMYSSGTTGLPKCLVQGPGVVLNHLKEHMIREDRVFYYTTTGWMMWNWLVSVLGVGATVVLFDGNPLYPSTQTLWQFAQDVGVTVFGTSARYLAAVMDSGCVPSKEFDLSKLRMITSTGSPASTNIFKFVYESIKSDVQFASISGGTDLNGCFALGCTNLPGIEELRICGFACFTIAVVHSLIWSTFGTAVCDSELQTRGLGLDVRIFDDNGKEIMQEKGELVCKQPFPSMPLYFWSDDNGIKYHDAYFDTFLDIWKHGDFAEVTKSGGVIIYGRSDATLKPGKKEMTQVLGMLLTPLMFRINLWIGGVRIGTADIYKVMERMDGVADSVVVGQSYTLKDGTPDVRILLFVVMADGHECTPAFQRKVRQHIHDQASPRHMPGLVVACPDIPHTVSGKKVELTVKKIIDGCEVTNKSALRNPESLIWFEEFAASLREKSKHAA